MTELEKAKLTVEINRLEKEADELEIKARNDESMFADAWAVYGSELAGPPQSITIDRNKANELRKKADFLRSVKDGLDNSLSLSDLDKKMSNLDLEIVRLNREKMLVYQNMKLARYLADVIK